MKTSTAITARQPWNKGKLVGQKTPLELKEIWAIRMKPSRPVQFEITEPARTAVSAWISHSKLKAEDYLFPSRIQASPHLSARQHARIVAFMDSSIGIGSFKLWHPYATADEGPWERRP